MPELTFSVESTEAVPSGTAPVLVTHVRIVNSKAAEKITSIALRCQFQIEPARRRYSEQQQNALADLFGTPDRWRQTLKPLAWAHTAVQVHPFIGKTLVDIIVPPPTDLNFAAARYLNTVQDGDIHALMLFSGSVFFRSENDDVQIAPIGWDREALFRVPARLFQETLRRHSAASGIVDPTVQACLRAAKQL